MEPTPARRIAVVTTPFILNEFQYIFMTQTVLSLLSMKHNFALDLIAVVNHFNQRAGSFDWVHKTFDLVQANEKNNLARAWNRGIRAGFERGAEYVLVINLDLTFHELFLENLVTFADAHRHALMWSGMEWDCQESIQAAPLQGEPSASAHFSCFLIDKKLFADIGEFDEQFEPAYHEDSDMLYRISLKNGTLLSTPSARFFHLERVTLKGAISEDDTAFLDGLRGLMDKSMERYRVKWGGLPGKEIYRSPYGK